MVICVVPYRLSNDAKGCEYLLTFYLLYLKCNTLFIILLCRLVSFAVNGWYRRRRSVSDLVSSFVVPVVLVSASALKFWSCSHHCRHRIKVSCRLVAMTQHYWRTTTARNRHVKYDWIRTRDRRVIARRTAAEAARW